MDFIFYRHRQFVFQDISHWSLTHWNQEQMATILQTAFQFIFSDVEIGVLCIFNQILLRYVASGPNDKLSTMFQIMLSCQKRQKAIIWTSESIVYWRICDSIGYDKNRVIP